MKTIDSQALGIMTKALGLAGAGAPQTELLDASVDQVIDVNQVVRRSRTLAGTEGVFRVVMRTVHTGAGSQFVSMQPYAAAPTGVIAPFPTPLPDTFDFWLYGASLERVSGAAFIDLATLRLTNVQQAFGINNSGVAVVSTSVFTLASWTGQEGRLTPTYGIRNLATQQTGVYQKINLRIPRKGAVASPFLAFSLTQDGTSTWDCVMLCGVFPVALGQDVAI